MEFEKFLRVLEDYVQSVSAGDLLAGAPELEKAFNTCVDARVASALKQSEKNMQKVIDSRIEAALKQFERNMIRALGGH